MQSHPAGSGRTAIANSSATQTAFARSVVVCRCCAAVATPHGLACCQIRCTRRESTSEVSTPSGFHTHSSHSDMPCWKRHSARACFRRGCCSFCCAIAPSRWAACHATPRHATHAGPWWWCHAFVAGVPVYGPLGVLVPSWGLVPGGPGRSLCTTPRMLAMHSWPVFRSMAHWGFAARCRGFGARWGFGVRWPLLPLPPVQVTM